MISIFEFELLAERFFKAGTTEETLFTGLSSEVGELMSERVDELRVDKKTPRDIDHRMAGELCDILWYITMIAQQRGYTLSQIMDMTIDKLDDRERNGKA